MAFQGSQVSPLGVQRPVVLCADDFAISAGVSAAIVDLIAQQRLSATSCMTASRYWRPLARDLLPFADRVEIGLHLTLTGGSPVGEMPRLAPAGRLPRLGPLMQRAFTGLLDRAEIAAELRRQVAAFAASAGRLPDFIDGHQHIHLLPVIREEVLALFAGPLAGQACYLRICWEPPWRILARGVAVAKASIIAALSLPLRRQALRLGIATNDSFRGVANFGEACDYAQHFPRFLRGPGSRPIIMCHPGLADAELAVADTVTGAREHEYAYLASDRFLADLAEADCRLSRFAR